MTQVSVGSVMNVSAAAAAPVVVFDVELKMK